MKNKTLTKILSAFLAVIMLLSIAPLNGFTELNLPDLFSVKAEAASYGDKCGNNLEWSLNTETGLLKISGVGPMYHYTDYDFAPWWSQRLSIQTVKIDEGVTSIGDYAFEFCKNLETVIIPDSVTSIGGYAFSNCENLTFIELSESITIIGFGAFYDCVNLKDVYYDGDIESWVAIKFGSYDFEFRNTNPLQYAENFYVKGEIQRDIVISQRATYISSGAFWGYDGLSSVVILAGVTSIGSYAFANCENLKLVEFSDDVTFFGDYIFSGCNNIISFTIGESYSHTGIETFSGCGNIENVYYRGDLKSWCEINFEFIPHIDAENLYIDGILMAGDFTFDSIPEISNSCFVGCDFSSLYLNNIKMIGSNAFASCEKLEDVVLENIVIISSGMFNECENLKEVYIPTSVKIIEQNAFVHCENIETVYYEGTEEEWNAIAVYPGNIDLVEANVVFLNNTGVRPNFAGKGEVSIEDLTINYKETVRLSENFKVNTGDSYKLTYKSSDKSVVTVDENGYVTGVGKGSAEITVTLTDAYGNEVSDTAVVTVETAWWQWLIIIFLFGWIWY